MNKRETEGFLFILINRMNFLLKMAFLWYNYVDKTNLNKGDLNGKSGRHKNRIYYLGATIET